MEITKTPATIDLRTAANLLGISPSAAYQQVKKGIFPADIIRAGNRILVTKASLYGILGLTNGVAENE